jgi:hypothetical protein
LFKFTQLLRGEGHSCQSPSVSIPQLGCMLSLTLVPRMNLVPLTILMIVISKPSAISSYSTRIPEMSSK